MVEKKEGLDSKKVNNTGEKKNINLDSVGCKRTISLVDYLLIIVISMIMSLVSIFIYDRYFAQKVAIVDLDSYVSSLRALYMLNKINEKDLDKYMEDAISAVKSKQDRYLILLGGVVVGRPKNVEVINLPNIPEAKNLRLEDLLKTLPNSTLVR